MLPSSLTSARPSARRDSSRSHAVSARSLTKTIAVALSATLVASGLVVAAAAPAQAAGNTTGAVSGTVFRDFNSSGTRDVGVASSGVATDLGLSGVTATAYDADGDAVGSGVTDASGAYSIPVAGARSSALRIEFALGQTLEDAGYNSSFAQGGASGVAGQSRSSVQFVTLNGGGTAVNADYAVNHPDDYSQSNPWMVTPIQHGGLDPAQNNLPTLVANRWSASNNGDQPKVGTGGSQTIETGNYSGRTTLATRAQTGAIWGSASAPDGIVFASASLRRHAVLGPLGIDGIYRLPNVLGASGTLNTPAPQQWLNLSDLGIDVLPAGEGVTEASFTAANRGITADRTSHDPLGYRLSGRAGIGGIAVSEDGATLYVVNLGDRKLYTIDIATGTQSGAAIDLGLAAGEMPWSVTVHRGSVYVGVTQTTGAVAMSVRAAAESNLASWTTVLNAPLSYDRGHPFYSPGNGASCASPGQAQFCRWNAWTASNDAAFKTNYVVTSWGAGSNLVNGAALAYPQPVLSSLAFDAQGYMTLALMDRFGSLQGGSSNWAPTALGGAPEPTFEIFSSGDSLIAAPSAGGNFTLESNGAVSGRTTATPAVGSPQGPGGKEFFEDLTKRLTSWIAPQPDANNVQSNTQTTSGSHQESTIGSVSIMPGVAEAAVVAYDPLAGVRAAGVVWFDLNNGRNNRGYMHSDSTPAGATSASFTKAGGLGDLELLRNLAPLQIGNYVWFDADQDGIQDADEPPISGVTVRLYAADGTTVLNTTTTNAQGQYYFEVDPATDYVVGFDSSTAAITGLERFITSASQLNLTTQVIGNETRDSNANPATGRASYRTGAVGENNHDIDAGYMANGGLEVRKIISGSTAVTSFDVYASCLDFRGDAVTGSPFALTVPADGTAVALPASLPAGSACTLLEDTTGLPSDMTVSYGGAANAGGVVSVLAGTPGVATVTNTFVAPPAPSFAVAKSNGTVTPAANSGEWNVSYTIDASNSGASPISYDLSDTPLFESTVNVLSAAAAVVSAPGITLVPGFDGNTNTQLVSGGTLAAGATHTFRVTFRVSVDADVATGLPTVLGSCPSGVTSPTTAVALNNQASMTVGSVTETDNGCANLPNLNFSKQLEATTPVAGQPGHYDVRYSLTVTETGNASTSYTLDDVFAFGSAVEVVAGSVLVDEPAAATSHLVSAFNGDTQTVIARDVPIADGAAAHVYEVTVRVKVGSAAATPTGAASLSCPPTNAPAGTAGGLNNLGSLSWHGGNIDDNACAPLGSVNVVKTLTSATPAGAGIWNVTYGIVVNNTSTDATAPAVSYDLDDTFRFAQGVATVAAPQVTIPSGTGGVVGTFTGAVGGTRIITGASIATGASHSYAVSARVSVPLSLGADAATLSVCPTGTLAESSSAALNNLAQLSTGGSTQNSTACAPLPSLSIVKSVSSGPVDNGDGTFTIGYEIVATNAGAVAADYSPTDELQFGAGVVVDAIAVASVDAASVLNASWNGTSDTALTTAALSLAAGASHSYSVTATVSIDSTTATAQSLACPATPAAGTNGGLSNAAFLGHNGLTAESVICAPLTLPTPIAPALDKKVLLASETVSAAPRAADTFYANGSPAPRVVAVADTVRYVLAVQAHPRFGATNVRVDDQLPAGVEYKSTVSSDKGSFDNTAGVWNIGTLAAGERVTLVLEATVTNKAVPGVLITNEAQLHAQLPGASTVEPVADRPTVSPAPEGGRNSNPVPGGGGIGADGDGFDAVDIVVPIAAALDKKVLIADEKVASVGAVNDTLFLDKKPNPRVVKRGDTVRYLLTVQAHVSYGASDLTVRDKLPRGVSYAGVHIASQGSFDGTEWKIGDLTPGQIVTLVIETTVNNQVTDAEVITNSAQLFAAGAEVADRPTQNPGIEGGRNTDSNPSGSGDGYDEVDIMVVSDPSVPVTPVLPPLAQTGFDGPLSLIIVLSALSALFAGAALMLTRRNARVATGRHSA